MRDAESGFAVPTRGSDLTRRALALGLLSLLALVGLLAGPVGQSRAAFINQFDFGFDASDASGGPAPMGGIKAVDINQETGDVLVGTLDGHVYQFDETGASLPFSGLGGNTVFTQSIGTWGDVEIDNSGTATQGRFYTANDSQQFWGFAPDGTALSGYPQNNSGETCGLAVGVEGHIFAGVLPATIREYAPTSPPTLIKSVGLNPPPSSMCDFDIDSEGNYLVPNHYGGGVVRKYKPDGTEGTVIDSATSTRGVAVDWSNDDIYVDRQDRVVHYAPTGGSPLDTFGLPDPPYPGLQSSTGLAVNPETHAVYVANNRSGYTRVEVFKPVVVPDATITGTEGNSKVMGTVDPAGGGEVTECYFEFGTTTSYELGKEDCQPTTTFNSVENVYAELPGLLGEQTYHFRLVAHNAEGKGSSADATITPHYVVGLQTDPAENVTRTTAKMKGHYEGNGEETHYYFEWGTTTAYGEESAVPPGDSAGSPTGTTQLEFDATGLEANTEYHYRVVATNPLGTSPGNDRTFKTPPAVQNVLTQDATNVGPKSAVINASFVGDGTETSYRFEWGQTAPLYGKETTETSAGSPNGPTPVSVELTGLNLETTYHYRVIMTNELGETFGLDKSFTTKPAVAGVTTLAATDISQEGVTLNGEFTGNGEETTYYFEYGPTTAYGKQTPEKSAGSPAGATPLSEGITEFEGYTTYHYRLVAENSFGKTFGPDQTFVTPDAPLPDVTIPSASNIGPTSATLSAEVNPNRWATVYSFEYGPTPEYGSSTILRDVIDGNDNSLVPVSVDVGGLTPGTTYHFRIVAINITGTTHGADQVFVTPDRPRIESSRATSVSTTGARLEARLVPNASPTSVRFEYGTGGSYGASTGAVGLPADTRSHPVAIDVSGLAPGTTYNFRVVAANAVGSSTGKAGSFTTAAAPPPPGTEPVTCRKGFVKRKGRCVRRKRCRKGFVRRKGRCVKRKAKKRRHGKRRHRNRAGRNG